MDMWVFQIYIIFKNKSIFELNNLNSGNLLMSIISPIKIFLLLDMFDKYLYYILFK
jgi:hypothetical protein